MLIINDRRIDVSKQSEGYATNRLSVGRLTARQADAMKRLRESLATGNERCAKNSANHESGVVVDTNADAIRWILDRIADAAEK